MHCSRRVYQQIIQYGNLEIINSNIKIDKTGDDVYFVIVSNIGGTITIDGGNLEISTISGGTNIDDSKITIDSKLIFLKGTSLKDKGKILQNYYTVTFDSNGGSAVTAQSIEAGQKATKPAAPTDYEILNGANSKWTQDSDGNISVRGSGEFSKFVGVKVDGKTVDEKYYTVKEGSTIVTLKPEYLNTLTAGKHTLEIVWTDGTADTTFTVDAKPANTDTKSPQTGDSSIALWIALLFVSGVGVVTTAVYGKKRHSVK